MQAWLIILSYLLTALGNSVNDLDLFTSDFSADSDELLFEYDDVETEPLLTSFAWDLHDTSLPQEGALMADALDGANTCATDSLEPAVKLRSRGAECETNDDEASTNPSGGEKKNPNTILGFPYIRMKNWATSFEDFTCNNHGFTYAVCDSGNFEDIERMFIGQYFSLSHCDLCKRNPLCFRSGHAAEIKPKAPAGAMRALY